MDATLTIREVATQTGVPAATLRAWERRYSFPVPQRTEGGHRRYLARDVELVKKAIALVADGWSAGSAVRHVQEEMPDEPDTTNRGGPGQGNTPQGADTTGVTTKRTESSNRPTGGPDASDAPRASTSAWRSSTRTSTGTLTETSTADSPKPAAIGQTGQTAAVTTPTSTPPGVDVEIVLLISTTLRRLLRVEEPAQIPQILADVVQQLGGTVVPADRADANCLPLDISVGVSEPLLVAADAYTLSRMRLESVLPGLIEDATLVVHRLRAAARA